MMNRRSFLRTSGAVAVGLSGGVVGLGYTTSTDSTVDVTVHQDVAITELLKEGDSDVDKFMTVIKNRLPSVFQTAVSGLETDVAVGKKDVSASVVGSGRDIQTVQTRVTDLYSWIGAAESQGEIESSGDSMVLLRKMPEGNLSTVGGYGMSGTLGLSTNYSVVWIDPEFAELDDVMYAVAHEVGHNLGLNHSYGSNIDGKNSVMLSPPYAQSNAVNRFGESIEDCDERVLRFNPKVEMKHLKL